MAFMWRVSSTMSVVLLIQAIWGGTANPSRSSEIENSSPRRLADSANSSPSSDFANSSPRSNADRPVLEMESGAWQPWIGQLRQKTTKFLGRRQTELMDCPVYLLVDPSIVDMTTEGYHTQFMVQSLFPTTTLWRTASSMLTALAGSLPEKSLVIVPEQEEASLLSALGSYGAGLLKEQVEHNEVHLMVLGSNSFGENHDVELINAVSSWSVAHAGSGNRCVSESGRVVWRELGGDGFGAGPTSLPHANAVYCMDAATLPEDVDGLYEDDGECYAWTSPFGYGRITHIGADFFDVNEDWVQLIESSAEAVCALQTRASNAGPVGNFIVLAAILQMHALIGS